MMCTRVGKLIYIPQLSMNLPSDYTRETATGLHGPIIPVWKVAPHLKNKDKKKMLFQIL